MSYVQADGFATSNPRKKRPYVRKSSTMPTGLVFPTSPPQLSELAFNIHGWALEDGMREQRGTFECINAYQATMVKGGFAAKVAELKILEDAVYRDDLTYTERELDPTLPERDSSVFRYLVVGYTLQEEDAFFVNNKTFARFSENELVGESMPSEANIIRWNDCLTPVLIVTPIKENTGTSVRLFGLVGPKSGLCQPVLITHERVFYRWEFRASAGARFTQRNKNWNQLVVEKAKLLTPLDIFKEEGEEKPARAAKKPRNTNRIKQEDNGDYIIHAPPAGNLQSKNGFEFFLCLDDLFKPSSEYAFQENDSQPRFVSHINIVLSPEIKDIVIGIRRNRSDRVIQEISCLMKKVEEPQDLALADSLALRYFATKDAMIDEIQANHVVREIIELWPRLSNLVNANILVRIKRAIDSANLVVDTINMEQMFMNVLAYMAIHQGIDEQSLSMKLIEFHQLASVLNQAQMAAASAPRTSSMDAVFLITLLRDLIRFDASERQARSVAVALSHGGAPLFAFEYYINFDMPDVSQQLDASIVEVLGNARDKSCGVNDVVIWAERLRWQIRQA